jgi:1,4-dihydroxy-2-naphthoate octaprenyltransferase
VSPPTPANEPCPQRLKHPLLRFFLATRPAFLSVTLIACLLGLAIAHADGVPLSGIRGLMTVLFALVAHAGVNVINDYFDAVNGSDAANQQRIFPFTGGSRFIQNGVLTAQQTRQLGYALLLAVIPAGLWLSWVSGPGLLWIGLIGLLIGWAYSAPPLQLMCRGWGELAVVAGWCLLVGGSDYVQRGELVWLPWLTALPYALLVGNILFINEFPDQTADASVGKRTLVVRLGHEHARWLYLLIALLAHGMVVALVAQQYLPRYAAVAALTLVVSFQAARDLLRFAAHPNELSRAIQLTIVAANLHGLLLMLGLSLA